MRDILYAFVNNDMNELINVKDAQKGNKYFCPICNGEMILRKSERQFKRPHFAHKNLSDNCSPETILHYGFKNLLFNKINDAIKNNIPLRFEWDCKHCEELHAGNLIKRVFLIKLEAELDNYRPDLTLYNGSNTVIAAIEIVVSHPPEPELIRYYKDNNVILIQFDLKSDNDLSILESDTLKPSLVDFCYNPQCETCNNYMQNTFMEIIEGPCWKCKNPMKVAVIENDFSRGGTHVGPEAFREEEIKIAKSKGVFIKEVYSKTMNGRYKANICNHCGAFCGEFYLFTDYVANPNLNHDRFRIGFHCDNCISKVEKV